MNDSYGPEGIANDEPRPSSLNEVPSQIEETDISVLSSYELDGGGMTLVGLGPVRSSMPSVDLAEEAESRRLPASEPPGPWGSDDEGLPPSIRPRRLGIWGVAVPGLIILAGAAVVFLRALSPSRPVAPPREAAISPVVAPASASLAVRLHGVDVRVFLDGQDRGQPPLLLTGLTPGSHALSITGAGYAPFEQPVTLVAGGMSTIEPALTALAPAPKADAVVEVGHDKGAAAHAVKPADVTAAESTESLVRASALTPAATGSLSITSSPPSNVVLDGKPLGKAPREIDVRSGKHTVVFIHPQYGRQSLTVSVEPGKTTSASADF